MHLILSGFAKIVTFPWQTSDIFSSLNKSKPDSMRMFLFLLMVQFVLQGTAHPWKPKSYIIIDTDGGLDDLRALTLFLNSKDIRVLAIIASNGATPAKVGYQKVKNLLHTYHHEGILTGINPAEISKKPFQYAVDFPWSDSIFQPSPETDFNDVLERIQNHTREKITFVQLGGAQSLSSYLTLHPNFANQIEQVLWTVEDPLEDSWNYQLSPASFHLLAEKNIPVVKIISKEGGLKYSHTLKNICPTGSQSMKKIFLKSFEAPSSTFNLMLFDELAWLFLSDSSFFQNSKLELGLKKTISTDDIESKILRTFLETGQNNYQVFNYFPIDSAMYTSDISVKLNEVIFKYGYEEWAACVIANELHRHIGIYAIVGVKMGIRVRDYFGAGPDELKVLSYAGSYPPISCINDGIQVSTGATVGHGLLTISQEQPPIPAMVFEYLGQKIKVTLNGNYLNEITTEIKQLEAIYGINSNIYWDLVRQIALKIWFQWDRNQIFEITPIK